MALKRLLTAFAVSAAVSSWAGMPARAAVRLETAVEPRETDVGGRVRLTVRLIHTENVRPEPPLRPERLGEFEIVDMKVTTQRTQNAENIQEAVYTLTAFEVGDSTIPPFAFAYRADDGALHSLETPAVPVKIKSVLGADSADIRDIKPPVRAFPASGLAWLAAGVAITAAGVWLFLRRRRASPIATDPATPPHERALEELTRLEENPQGPARVFYTRLIDVLRVYLEIGLDISAMDRTSGELIHALKSRFDAQTSLDLREILERGDLAKFARQELEPEGRRRDVQRIRQFVLDTRPAPSAPEPAATAVS